MNKMDPNTKYSLIMAAVIPIVALSIMLFAASQEARVFNKYKKPETPAATTWDALFANLRVETND